MVAEVITIAEPGRTPHEVKSYKPISLLLVILKLFEKLLCNRLKPVVQNAELIPDHKFCFRQSIRQ